MGGFNMSHTATRGVHPTSYDDSYVEERGEHVTGWVGWIGFAGFMMMLGGIFQAISGLVGIFSNSFFAVSNASNQLLVIHDVQTWGWFNLIMGTIIVAAGIALFSGSMWARIIAVTLAMLSAIANLVSISLYPAWSIICLTISVLVIYAVIVHGNELREE
jgi:hypothetical protein